MKMKMGGKKLNLMRCKLWLIYMQIRINSHRTWFLKLVTQNILLKIKTFMSSLKCKNAESERIKKWWCNNVGSQPMREKNAASERETQ